MTPSHAFTAVGHATNDTLTQGHAPGGSVLYAASAARFLGASARIVSSVGDDFVGRDLTRAWGVEMRGAPSRCTTTFENRYVQGHREQTVSAVADPITHVVDTRGAVFACPVMGEVDPSLVVKRHDNVLGAGLQGWLRVVGPSGRVQRRHYDRWSAFAHFDVVFASDEDFGDDLEPSVHVLRETVPVVVITMGDRGAVVFQADGSTHVRAHPTTQVDPTGAGDVFAATCLYQIAKGEDVVQAAVWGVCAASVVIEDHGPRALPALAALESRVQWYTRNIAPPVHMPSARTTHARK
jgi:1D-myo-inositol 3-kinase